MPGTAKANYTVKTTNGHIFKTHLDKIKFLDVTYVVSLLFLGSFQVVCGLVEFDSRDKSPREFRLWGKVYHPIPKKKLHRKKSTLSPPLRSRRKGPPAGHCHSWWGWGRGRGVLEKKYVLDAAINSGNAAAAALPSCFEVVWLPDPLPADIDRSPGSACSRIALLTDADPLAPDVTETLSQHGWRCVVVGCWPVHHEGMVNGIQRADQQLGGLDHTVLLFSHWADALGDVGCEALLYTAQALVQMQLSCRLWVVTQGAQAVHAWHDAVALPYAASVGLARVIMQEHPSLRCTVVDVGAGDSGVDALRQELEASGDSQGGQVAWRDGVRYTPRLENSIQASLTVPMRLAAWRVRARCGGDEESAVFVEDSGTEPAAGCVQVEVEAAQLSLAGLGYGLAGPEPSDVHTRSIAGVVKAVGWGHTSF